MKAAAAVLGASLLFFLAVLTGAGRREAIPPPAAIPLGVGNPTASGAPPAPGPAPPGTPQTPAPSPPGLNPSPATTATTNRTDATAPPGSAAVEPPATTTSTTGGTTGPSTTSTTAGPVEEVDNQVDCSSTGKRGKGKREPCPPNGGAPGGGGDR